MSPAEVEPHRKVDLKDAPISEETKDKFNNLCNKFDCIISKGSDDIGKTLLVEMDIDTGNSPPIVSRPYTLPLKHYEWVRNEITTLERAGIITKSISPWWKHLFSFFSCCRWWLKLKRLTDSLRRRFHPSMSLAETVIYLFI